MLAEVKRGVRHPARATLSGLRRRHNLPVTHALIEHLPRRALRLQRAVQRGLERLGRRHLSPQLQLEIGVAGQRQRRTPPILQHVNRDRPPVEVERKIPRRALADGCGGFQQPLAGESAQLAD